MLFMKEKYRIIAMAVAILIISFMSYSSSVNAAEEKIGLEVMFIDVGQGDATLISCDGHYMLIDGGTADKSDLIYTVLKNKGIRHLDAIVATHPHADHVGGLPGALAYAFCDVAYSPVAQYDNAAFKKFNDSLVKNGVPLIVPENGSRINLGSAVLTVLGPTDIEKSMDPNDISLVLRLDYGSTSFLFTGDAEQEEQQLIMWNHYELLDVDCLKASHHGSYNGASRAFMQAVTPEITVVSCGTGNSYGHPHADALSEYKKTNCLLYRTDMQGDVYVYSDGKNLSVKTEKQTAYDIWTPGSVNSGKGSSASTARTTAAQPSVQKNTESSQQTSAANTYILNTHTLKFHYPSCSSVNAMKDKNKEEYTGSRDDIISKGYSPCGRCHP